MDSALGYSVAGRPVTAAGVLLHVFVRRRRSAMRGRWYRHLANEIETCCISYFPCPNFGKLIINNKIDKIHEYHSIQNIQIFITRSRFVLAPTSLYQPIQRNKAHPMASSSHVLTQLRAPQKLNDIILYWNLTTSYLSGLLCQAGSESHNALRIVIPS